MELSPKQQINELVKKSQKILLISHASLNGDSLGGMLALSRVLEKEGKEVTIVASENIDEKLTFLPGIQKIKKDISGTRDFILQIDKSKTPIEKLSYNEENNILNIIISPKDGQIFAENVKMLQGEFKFDLIFVLDTPDVDKIDSVYDRHTELFFETPIINVDHHVGNEYFGTVNMVDLTATSTCEILVSIIESMGPNNFDEDVATCLLAGIISDTGSFKNINTTPKSLTISAQMLAAGARQQEIIQNLYKTRPLKTLKLWGKVLARLEYDKDHRFIYSFVTYDDFKETGSSIEDIRNVMDELLSSTPGADVVLLLAEHEPTKVAGKLKGIHGQDVLAIAEMFGGSGHAQSAGFDLTNISVENAIPDVINRVRDFRSLQLGRGKIEKIEKPLELEIPKTGDEKSAVHNHLPEQPKETLAEEEIQKAETAPEDEIVKEIESLNKKIDEISEPEEVHLNSEEEKAETEELFDKFIGADTENSLLTAEELREEPKDVPVMDPIVQALESLEQEEKEKDSLLDELQREEQIAQESMEEAETETTKEDSDKDVDEEEIEKKTNLQGPNVDIPELSKEDTLKALGEIIRGHKPGEGLEKGKNNDNK